LSQLREKGKKRDTAMSSERSMLLRAVLRFVLHDHFFLFQIESIYGTASFNLPTMISELSQNCYSLRYSSTVGLARTFFTLADRIKQ
jgi:hypothetical protein